MKKAGGSVDPEWVSLNVSSGMSLHESLNIQMDVLVNDTAAHQLSMSCLRTSL